jgi:DtxR family Mn-dependent transcriptional regulator
MSTFTEENYLKCIWHLSLNDESVTTNQIAAAIHTRAASVTDMLKKLADKELINYAKYQGVTLTKSGEKIALQIVRKHRLWEYFLVEKLNFKWDEVHEVAEELEHISSQELVERLDTFMNYPRFDPHGDPIPDADGIFRVNNLKPISLLQVNESGIISGVRDHSAAFFNYLEKKELNIGKTMTVIEFIDYDHSVLIATDDHQIHISREVAENLLIML